MEVLAPAGGPQHLTAAIRCGADAVYLGGSRLSARAGAANFSPEALEKAVRECHRNGVRVYLAVNTLLIEGEEAILLDTLRLAGDLSIDALIIQDWGIARFARRFLPDMPLHASTQTSIHTPKGAALAKELGFSRLVLARELSESQIGAIVRRSGIECEIFVHGSLCGGVSGQCYYSAFLGGRSGNRGQCAQPCRLDVKAGKRGYALSLKDLTLLKLIDRIRALGVCSLKIEGRMKRPEYVAAAVTACRQALQGQTPDIGQLRAVFSREGFTDGYFAGTGQDMGGIRSREDGQSTRTALPLWARLGETAVKRRAFHLEFTLSPNKPALLETVEGNQRIAAEGAVPEPARNRDVTAEDAERQLCKWGGTPYEVISFTAHIEPGLNLPVSQQNALRRALCEKLYEQTESTLFRHHHPTEEIWGRQDAEISDGYYCECRTLDQWKSLRDKDCVITLPAALVCGRPEIEPSEGLWISLPRWMGGQEDNLFQTLKSLRKRGFSHLFCHNLGHIALGKALDYTLHGGWGLNLTNHQSLLALGELGVCDAVLSFELRGSQAFGGLPSGQVVYGHLPMMLLCRCPIRDGVPCQEGSGCKGKLIDRKGRAMTLCCDGHSAELLNPDLLWTADRLAELPPVRRWLNFTVETGREAANVLESYRNGAPPPERFTRGLLFRGVV